MDYMQYSYASLDESERRAFAEELANYELNVPSWLKDRDAKCFYQRNRGMIGEAERYWFIKFIFAPIVLGKMERAFIPIELCKADVFRIENHQQLTAATEKISWIKEASVHEEQNTGEDGFLEICDPKTISKKTVRFPLEIGTCSSNALVMNLMQCNAIARWPYDLPFLCLFAYTREWIKHKFDWLNQGRINPSLELSLENNSKQFNLL